MEIDSIAEDESGDESTDEELRQKLEKALEQEKKIKIGAEKFFSQNEDFAVNTIPVSPEDEVTITEYAP